MGFPEEPELARVVGEEIFLWEAFGDGEFRCAFSDDHDVGSFFHHGTGELGDVTNVPDCGNASDLARGAVHDAGVEFHDSVLIGKAAESDAMVVGVVFAALADVDGSVESVRAALEHGIGFGDAVVVRLPGDDDRSLRGHVFDWVGLGICWSFAEGATAEAGGNDCAGREEVAASDRHFVAIAFREACGRAILLNPAVL